MLTIDEKTRQLFALLDEMKKAAEEENYKKVQEINKKYETLNSNTKNFSLDNLDLEIYDCRQAFILATTAHSFNNYLVFLHDAKMKYNKIKPKIVEKCILKKGLDTGAIKEEDLDKPELDCIYNWCDGYNINCKKHPEYKRYKQIKNFLLKKWNVGFFNFLKEKFLNFNFL